MQENFGIDSKNAFLILNQKDENKKLMIGKTSNCKNIILTDQCRIENNEYNINACLYIVLLYDMDKRCEKWHRLLI